MKKPFNTRLDSDLRRDFDIERAKRGLKLEPALEAAITEWLGRTFTPSEDKSADVAKLRAADREAVSELIYILTNAEAPEHRIDAKHLRIMLTDYAKERKSRS